MRLSDQQIGEITPVSSTSSMGEISSDSDSSLVDYLEEADRDTFKYLYSEQYGQNFNIGRVSISRGRSGSRHREKTKCECNENDESQQTPNNKEKRKPSKQRYNKKTNKTTETANNNKQNGPRVAIQFDLNKLLEEITKSDKKTCCLCGKPRKNFGNQEPKRDTPSKKTLHLNTLQDGKISFFLNEKLKISIEEDTLSPKYKKMEDLENKTKSDSGSKKKEEKKSTTYTNASDTYQVETVNKIPCPSSCPMVKLKQLLAPEDKRLVSCLKKRSETTNNSSRQSKRNRDKSLQTSRTRECGTFCSRKKQKTTGTLHSEDIKVTCNGEESEGKVSQEVIKDGDNVKIIVRVRRPNTPTSTRPSSANSTTSSHQHDTEYSQDSRSSRSEYSTSEKINCSGTTCPFLKSAENLSEHQGVPSRTSKISTINIIMSPKSTQMFKSEETLDGRNENSSTLECWSKLEEFIDKKIEELRLNSTRRNETHISRKHARSARFKRKHSRSKKKKIMVNRSLAVPSSVLVIGREDKDASTKSLTYRRCSKVCFRNNVWGICKGNSGFKECTPKTSKHKSNSDRELSKKMDVQIKLLCPKATNIYNDTKSEGDMSHSKSNPRQDPERSKSLCQIIKEICGENFLGDCDIERLNKSHNNAQTQRKSRGKVNEISIQTDLELAENLVLKISSPQVESDRVNRKKDTQSRNRSESEVRRRFCKCSNNKSIEDQNKDEDDSAKRSDRNWETVEKRNSRKTTENDVQVESDLGVKEYKRSPVMIFVDEGTSTADGKKKED